MKTIHTCDLANLSVTLTLLVLPLKALPTACFQDAPVNGGNIAGTGDKRDVTVNLTSGTGEFRLRVLD